MTATTVGTWHECIRIIRVNPYYSETLLCRLGHGFKCQRTIKAAMMGLPLITIKFVQILATTREMGDRHCKRYHHEGTTCWKKASEVGKLSECGLESYL